jgi:sulfide:quinone oxidoreductase
MANIVILGGGFGGIVAAESLAKRLGNEHQITLVSRRRKFAFYPALVRFAFGRCSPDDIEFDVREAIEDLRVRFVEGEVARVYPLERQLTFDRGDFTGNMDYDYLVLALGGRLRTELIGGFFEYANHLLRIPAADKFGIAVRNFHRGQAVIGYCAGARQPVAVFETAFALARVLEERDERDNCVVKIVSKETPAEMFSGVQVTGPLEGLKSHRIEFISNFEIGKVTATSVVSTDGREVPYDLNMIIPPLGGPGALVGTGIIDGEGYVRVDPTMRAVGADYVYAVGDCVSFEGPKMAHMAVRQAEVAAENLAAEILGKAPSAHYDHEMRLVIDTDGSDSTFIQKDLWTDEPAEVSNSRFWGWAKRRQQDYWKARHA